MRACAVRGVDEEGMTGMDEGVGWFKTQVTGAALEWSLVSPTRHWQPRPSRSLSLMCLPSGTAPRPSTHRRTRALKLTLQAMDHRPLARCTVYGAQTPGSLTRCSFARAMRQVEARCIPSYADATLTGVLNEGALGLRTPEPEPEIVRRASFCAVSKLDRSIDRSIESARIGVSSRLGSCSVTVHSFTPSPSPSPSRCSGPRVAARARRTAVLRQMQMELRRCQYACGGRVDQLLSCLYMCLATTVAVAAATIVCLLSDEAVTCLSPGRRRRLIASSPHRHRHRRSTLEHCRQNPP